MKVVVDASDAILITADKKYYRKAQSLGSLILLRTFGENRAKPPAPKP